MVNGRGLDAGGVGSVGSSDPQSSLSFSSLAAFTSRARSSLAGPIHFRRFLNLRATRFRDFLI